MGKTKAEKEFERMKSLHEDFDIEMKVGRRHHLSTKKITTLRLNAKGRLTIPTQVATKLGLSQFEFFRVGHAKGKLYILFQKEASHESKKFFSFGEKDKDTTCYLELGPQLRKLDIEWEESFDLPFDTKEVGLLELDIRPMNSTLSKKP